MNFTHFKIRDSGLLNNSCKQHHDPISEHSNHDKAIPQVHLLSLPKPANPFSISVDLCRIANILHFYGTVDDFLTISKTIRNAENENEGTNIMKAISNFSLNKSVKRMSNMMVKIYKTSPRIPHQMTNSTVSHIKIQIHGHNNFPFWNKKRNGFANNGIRPYVDFSLGI